MTENLENLEFKDQEIFQRLNTLERAVATLQDQLTKTNLTLNQLIASHEELVHQVFKAE